MKILSRTEGIDLTAKYDDGHLLRKSSIFHDYLCRRVAAEWRLLCTKQ
ncbi:MAG: hypothetical protein GX111_05425 [Clostridiales bacterium]|nr:hypothetical protein [Clostridiales bacterium]